jgi:hypothetical protein
VRVLTAGKQPMKMLRGCPIGRASNSLWNRQPAKHEAGQTKLNVANA